MGVSLFKGFSHAVNEVSQFGRLSSLLQSCRQSSGCSATERRTPVGASFTELFNRSLDVTSSAQGFASTSGSLMRPDFQRRIHAYSARFHEIVRRSFMEVSGVDLCCLQLSRSVKTRSRTSGCLPPGQRFSGERFPFEE